MADLIVTDLLLNIIIIAVSFVILNYASNLTITNALKVSNLTKLGKTAVGFSILAFSTSLPELTVALIAAFSGGAAISVGNVLGSNIVNISVVVGLAALIVALMSRRKSSYPPPPPPDGPIPPSSSNGFNVIPNIAKSELSSIYFGLFISSLVPMILIYISTATWVVGLILLFIFVGYMYQLTKVRIPSEDGEEPTLEEKSKLRRYTLLTIGGAIGVVASAYFLVESSVAIAQTMGIPETIIGATIIAVGTSLPEIILGLKAILRGHSALAFGEIIGSSFMNITLILGISFFIPGLLGQPLTMNLGVFQNLVIFSIITNLFFWYFLSREKIGWQEGAIFIFIYALFLVTTLGIIQPQPATATLNLMMR
jgi:cation:H+ antiporter